MKVRYTDTALGEIDEICSHIVQDNPIVAADVAAAIERKRFERPTSRVHGF